MRLKIKIDANYEDPEALITTARMTDEVNRIVDFISKSDSVTTIISGIKDDKVELLEQGTLFRIYAGTICMELSNGDVSFVSRRHVSKIKKLLGL